MTRNPERSLPSNGIEPTTKPSNWGTSLGGNLWRTTGDMKGTYKRMADIGFNQIGIAE